MKMERGRNVEIAMAVYIALGVAIIHATLYDLIFSACCGLLSLAIMMKNGGSTQKFEKYDSWGWSNAATKGSSIWAVIFFVGGLPLWQRLTYSYFSGHKSLAIPYGETVGIVLFGAMVGIGVYFRGYLKPVDNETTNPKALELEHKECFGLFQTGVVIGGFVFVATGYTYLSELTSKVEKTVRVFPQTGKESVLSAIIYLSYSAVGYMIWILRPLYGRCKEVRDHLNKLKQAEDSSKQLGAKNET